MSFAMGTVRYILFFFNFLLALAGLGILALGIITAHSKGATLDNVIQGQLSTPAIVFAVIGGCIFLFAFFGCCGALRESHCMIITYAVLLLTLFLLQVAVAVLAYTFQGETEEVVSAQVKKTFAKYNNDTDVKGFVDKIQEEVHCCGSVDNKTPWNALLIPAPDSCYPKDSRVIYEQGCIPKITQIVVDALVVIGRVAIAIGVVEVIGIIFSLCLAHSIRRSELRGYA